MRRFQNETTYIDSYHQLLYLGFRKTTFMESQVKQLPDSLALPAAHLTLHFFFSGRTFYIEVVPVFWTVC